MVEQRAENVTSKLTDYPIATVSDWRVAGKPGRDREFRRLVLSRMPDEEAARGYNQRRRVAVFLTS